MSNSGRRYAPELQSSPGTPMSRRAALLIGTVFAVGFVVIIAPVAMGDVGRANAASRIALAAIQAWFAWTHLAHALVHTRAADEGPEGGA